MSAVLQLPTRANEASLWRAYAELVRAQQDEPALLADRAHNIAIARAWAAWRDTFLASDASC